MEELDKESFDDIVKNSVSRISQIYPEWTNYNSADSGMALIELLSWFKENQQYHLNVITNEHLRRYLKLLGKIPANKICAQTVLSLEGNGDVPPFEKFYADDIPFETQEEFYVQNMKISRLENSEISVLHNGGNIVFYPFGEDAEKNDVFRICFSGNVGGNGIISLYVFVRQDGYVLGDKDDFAGLTELTAQYICGLKNQRVEIISDETCGFFRSGIIRLHIKKIFHDSNDARIEFSVKKGKYICMPIITGIEINALKSTQKNSFSRIIDCKGMAFINPSQQHRVFCMDGNKRYETNKFEIKGNVLEVSDRRYESFEVIEYAQGAEDLLNVGYCNGEGNISFETDLKNAVESCIEIYVYEEDGIYRWNRVLDFDNSDEYSRDFVFENQSIKFGDGEKGKCPEGKVLIVSCAESLGEGGNIKSGTINSDNGFIKAENITDAVNGSNEENLQECFAQVRKRISQPQMCVTFSDYEKKVLSTAGLPIRRVRTYRGAENEIITVAESGGMPLNETHYKILEKSIYPFVPIGTKLSFVSPLYVDVNIFVMMSVYRSEEDITELTRAAAEKYFDSDEAGFGAVITRAGLEKFIMDNVPVHKIYALEISFTGNNAVMISNGDFRLLDNALPRCFNVNTQIKTADGLL